MKRQTYSVSITDNTGAVLVLRTITSLTSDPTTPISTVCIILPLSVLPTHGTLRRSPHPFGGIMVQLWPGDLESYFAYCDEQNRRDRLAREDYARGLATLCEHGRPVVYYCASCNDGQPNAMLKNSTQ